MDGGERTRVAVAGVAGTWATIVAGVVAVVVFAHRLAEAGRSDLFGLGGAVWVLYVAIASALVVGTTLVLRQPRHPVGWCFLALAVAIALSGVVEGYAVYGAVARPGALPGADAVAYLNDATYLPWLVLVALVLHLTPTGRPLSPRWRTVAGLTVVSAALAAVGTVLTTSPLDPPFQAVRSPWGLDGLRGPLDAVRGLGALGTGLGLVAAGASTVVRFRRAQGDERRQLLWLAFAAAVLPLFVPAAFVSAWAGEPTALLVATGGFIVVVPVATGLAISRYHLYDVERILSRALTYALLSAVVAGAYAVVVVSAGRALAEIGDSTDASTVLATLAAVTVAAPARRTLQDAIDRHFNRRRFDALRTIDDHLRRPAADRTIDEVLRLALGDPRLGVSYWVDERGDWVSADGLPAGPPGPAEGAVEARRQGRPVARVVFDRGAVERPLVEAAVAAALPELDNTRLRAAITLQLVEVHESRARIAAAQAAERHKLERDLHDGAQQRLLAVAFQLKAAHLNGDPGRLREAVADGIDQALATVGELRALANGLAPAALVEAGLATALDDLAARSPVPVEVRCADARFPPPVESTAWLIICEAVANAHKHAAATRLSIRVAAADGWLGFEVTDDGRGGADPSGTGLRGLRDRAEAAGGSVEVCSPRDGGTIVRGRLPCGP